MSRGGRLALAAALLVAAASAAAAAKCGVTQPDVTRTPFSIDYGSISNWTLTPRNGKGSTPYMRFCFKIASDAKRGGKACSENNNTAADCCVTGDPKFRAVTLAFTSDATCAADKAGKAAFRKAFFSLDKEAQDKRSQDVSSSFRSKDGTFQIKFKPKASLAGGRDLCLNVPVPAGSKCQTLKQLCGGGECKYAITTAAFKPAGSKKKQTCCIGGVVKDPVITPNITGNGTNNATNAGPACIDSATGGGLAIPGLMNLTFPAGAFSNLTCVDYAVSAPPDSFDQLFQAASLMFGLESEGSVVVTLRLSQQPLVPLPASLALAGFGVSTSAGGGRTALMLLLNKWVDTQLESYDSLETTGERALATAPQLVTQVPPTAFYQTADGGWEARVMMAVAVPLVGNPMTEGGLSTNPLGAGAPAAAEAAAAGDLQPGGFVPAVLGAGAPQLPRGPDAQGQLAAAGGAGGAPAGGRRRRRRLLAPPACAGVSLLRPVAEEVAVAGGYGRRGAGFHYGVDYSLQPGTNVTASHDGTMVIKQQTDKAGNLVGYGYYVIVRSPGIGATLYAQLAPGSAGPVGTKRKVKAAEVIGQPGGSGGSASPHLHYEYAPDGNFFRTTGKVDPEPCFARSANGSISIRDDGNWADDAFDVLLNSQKVCSTTPGAANSCALGALRPGQYQITVVATVAPDNEATFEIRTSEPNISLCLGPDTGCEQVMQGYMQLGQSLAYVLQACEPGTPAPCLLGTSF